MPAPTIPVSLHPLQVVDESRRALVRFNPTGPARPHLANPWRVQRGVLQACRIFVGLNVGGRPRWKKKDVIGLVQRLWRREASFIEQDGLWTVAAGKVKPEKSVQVVILNVFGIAKRDFVTQMGELCTALATRLEQELVIGELQENGRTVGTIFASP